MRVLISGAGIAGSSAAYFLAKIGVHVSVIEKCHALLPHGQNVDIQGSAVTAIKKMHLLSRLKDYNTTEKGTQFINNKGHPIAPFPIREGSIASPTSQYEILRGDLALILYEAASSLPDVDYSFDTTIKRIIDKGDDVTPVTVELSNGEVCEYDLLIAADGQWSKTRQQCFPAESIKVIDKDMYVSYYTIPRTSTDNDYWNLYFGLQKRVVSLRPDPHGTIRAMFSKMPCDETERSEWQNAVRADKCKQKALLRKAFAGAGWETQRILNGLEEAPDFYFQAMQQIKMEKWWTSRVICIGDAAHAPTPLTGVGTSLAITGAYVLAGELSSLKHGEPITAALNSYDRRFRPFVEKMQHIPSGVPGHAHPRAEWQRWLLQTFVIMLSWVLPKILAIPFVSSKVHTNNEENDDGFPLPRYACFEGEKEEEEEKAKV